MVQIIQRILISIIAIPITILGLMYYIIFGNETNSNDTGRGNN